MMSAMEKNPSTKLTISVKGGGALGTVLAVTDGNTVRGYAAVPDVNMPLKNGKLDVGGAVGANGLLSVVKDFGSGEPYTSQVELVSGEIAEDLAYYYTSSEQVPTAISLGVLVGTDLSPKAAGGYIIQLMPGFGDNDEKIITEVENRIKTLPPISTMIANGSTAEDIIGQLLGDISYNVLGGVVPEYKCGCSRERVCKALISMGKAELQDIIDDGKGASINCHFCNASYDFSTDDLINLLQCSNGVL